MLKPGPTPLCTYFPHKIPTITTHGHEYTIR